jgi:hypothetical protein
MVPVRFIAETYESEVLWKPGYEEDWGIKDNVVEIYNKMPVTVKPLKIGISSIKDSFKHIFIDEGEWDVSGSYDVLIPQFVGLSDAAFRAKLNGDLKARLESIAQGVQDNIAEQNEGYEKYPEWEYYNYYEDLYYRIVGVHHDVLVIMLYGYIYMGGAHGMPVMEAINIDTINNKVLRFEDLFIKVDYEKILLKEIQDLWLKDEVYEFGFAKEVDYLPLDSAFYFEEGNLNVFYPPYELASYARGFVEFSIPLAKLSEILKDEYR